MTTDEKRIGFLDSFRFIAITMVALYHYYGVWVLPAGSEKLGGFARVFNSPLANMGFLGVHFFFIISGFVIYFTLTRSVSYKQFFTKRFIRIYPPLLLAACISFISAKILDTGNRFPQFHNTPVDFLPSLTFIEPYFWGKIFNHTRYIDGAYWSLIPEIRFYLLAGAIFFLLKKKKNFMRNWTIVLVSIIIAYQILKLIGHEKLFENIFFYRYIGFFSIGICLYDYYINRKIRFEYIIPLIFSGFILSEQFEKPLISLLFVFGFIVLFLLFILNEHFLRLLTFAPIRRIGMISYTIYLLHQNIGIIVIAHIYALIPYKFYVLIPLLVYFTFIVIAEVLYRIYELPVKRWLYRALLKRN